MSFRIGQGYDVHQLKSDLSLIIGGVNIPHTQGVVAHSDGDVLLHAIIDAMLGATNLGDIGQLFPNSKQWEKQRKQFNPKEYKSFLEESPWPMNFCSAISGEGCKGLTEVMIIKATLPSCNEKPK